MEFDYNKCPECGYVNTNRPDVCPSCGFNLKEYRNNLLEQQVKEMFDAVKILKVLFEETEEKFIVKNDATVILEKEFGIDNDNKTPEMYQKSIAKIEQYLKDIEGFKDVFRLVKNYINCDKYIDLLNKAYNVFEDFKEQQGVALVNSDKDGARWKALLACVVDGVFKINVSLFKICKLSSNLIIPDSAKSIGEGACHNFKFKSVVIPNSVESIGDGAFYKCNSLESIIIPDSVTSIGAEAFSYCSSLTSVKV